MTGPSRGAAVRPRQLESLDVDECVRLLEAHYVGRVACVREGFPEVLPVNYRFVDGAVVFRTSWGDRLDLFASGVPAAFEIDALDPVGHGGWSVLVRGRTEEVSDPEELERCRALPLRPWAPGERDHYVRILPAAITGRRLRRPLPGFHNSDIR